MTTINTENGIETVENCGMIQLRCVECGRWVRSASERIRHAKSCDSRAQPAAEPTIVSVDRDQQIRRAARQGSVSAVASEDEIATLVRLGRLSIDDAMNRDF